MKAVFDLAIVGSGFGGSLLAMAARRLGRSVILLEKGAHPRFAIGESSTPLANVLLDQISREFDLPLLAPFVKWGSWRRERPEIACGLKRGFTFLRHEFARAFAAAPDRRDQLLVAASPRNEISDTHWYRAEFDAHLVSLARDLGVEYVDRIRLDRYRETSSGVALEGDREGRRLAVRAKFVVDASGPRGFLFRSLDLPEVGFRGLPATQGLFTHFEGVERLDEMFALDLRGAPYPADDAAVHHVFDGGWIWVLRFSNGIVSAGCAVTDALAGELDLATGDQAWSRLMSRLPTVRDQFSRATPLLPWVHSRRLPFRAGIVAGKNWALLPSAAAFVDPLFSTGIPLTLLGIQRFSRAIRDDWDSPRFAPRLRVEAERSLAEADASAALAGALYPNFNEFPIFSALTMLYFAAASFSEAARRLGRTGLGPSFLLHDDPKFGAAFRAICETALDTARPSATPESRRDLIESIRCAIEPINIAGLCDPARRNWYPVEAEDLLRSAGKLGATREEVAAMLERTGFF
jgi:tetracycline 7-halogenase / FADH2 O2-dependent halogenase